MNTPAVYVICDNNCKYEGMTKEQILSAITQAVEGGKITNLDKGFITTLLTVNNVSIKFFYGEQAAYDALTEEQKENLYAIITNDTFKADVNEALEQLNTDVEELRDDFEALNTNLANGSMVVGAAKILNTQLRSISSGSTLDLPNGAIIIAYFGTDTLPMILISRGSGIYVKSTSGSNGQFIEYVYVGATGLMSLKACNKDGTMQSGTIYYHRII